MAMPDQENQHVTDRRYVSNLTLWEELRYIRGKVDDLENKVLIMFGSVSAIAVAVAIYEVLKS